MSSFDGFKHVTGTDRFTFRIVIVRAQKTYSNCFGGVRVPLEYKPHRYLVEYNARNGEAFPPIEDMSFFWARALRSILLFVAVRGVPASKKGVIHRSAQRFYALKVCFKTYPYISMGRHY